MFGSPQALKRFQRPPRPSTATFNDVYLTSEPQEEQSAKTPIRAYAIVCNFLRVLLPMKQARLFHTSYPSSL